MIFEKGNTMKHTFYNEENYSLLIPAVPVIESLKEKEILFVEVSEAFDVREDFKSVFVNITCKDTAYLNMYGSTISLFHNNEHVRAVSIKLTAEQVKEVEQILGIELLVA